MPVHRQKKDATPTTPGSTQEQAAAPLPDPQTFQQYLRELARGAMRVVLEGVMREELDALIFYVPSLHNNWYGIYCH